MKEIVINPQNPQLYMNKFYGVDLKEAGKGIITRDYFFNGLFRIKSFEMFTGGNYFTRKDFLSTDLNELMRNVVDFGYHIYEFETFLELAQWADKRD